jgi:hypothetical protein
VAKALRIAFVTPYDARDRKFWSGTPFNISRALERCPIEVSHVGNLSMGKGLKSRRVRGAFYRRVLGQTYLPERDLRLASELGRQVGHRFHSTGAALAFSLGSLAVARLPASVPFSFYTSRRATSARTVFATVTFSSARLWIEPDLLSMLQNGLREAR